MNQARLGDHCAGAAPAPSTYPHTSKMAKWQAGKCRNAVAAASGFRNILLMDTTFDRSVGVLHDPGYGGRVHIRRSGRRSRKAALIILGGDGRGRRSGPRLAVETFEVQGDLIVGHSGIPVD